VALVAIWAVGFAVCIARLLAGLCWTWWTARRARHVTQPDWVTDLAAASASLGLRAPVTMLTSTHAAMPAVHGLWRARLLLPAQAQAWTAERRRVVLLHELAHVLRRDVAVQILARLAAAVHWFNPLAHMAVRQLRIEQERACDDVVLACGPSGTEYADHLVEIAQGGRASLAGADGWVTVGMARPTQLETRLHAILDPGADRRALSLRSRALLAASVMAVALPLASLRVTAAAAAPGQSPGTVEGTVEPVPTTPEPVPTTPEPAPTTREPASRTPEPARVVAVAPGSVTSGARVSAVAAPAVVAAAPGGGRQVAAVQSVPATAAPTALVSAVQAAAQAEQSQDTRRRAVEALTIAVGDDNENVRLQAVRALAGLGGSVAVDALTRALKDESPRIRAEAAQALGAVAHGAAGAQQREQAAVRELRAREMEMAFTAQRRQFDTELAELQRQLQRTQEGGASLENLRRELEVSATQRRDLEARLREMERALAEARRELEQARQR
jgi:beta-lactamase regulating signal transducer with metallopeptidase domain